MLLFVYLVRCLSVTEVTHKVWSQSLLGKLYIIHHYTSVIVEHAEKSYHRDAMIAAQTFRESIENASTTLTCVFDKEKEKTH